jgi:perosamine synthetase
VAKKHNLPVIEDACQAHLAEWRGRKVGNFGAAGCYSFQVTKNLPSGDGGAVITNDANLAQRIYAFHNNCRPRKMDSFNFTYLPMRAANFRMTEFQGAVLNVQMTRLEQYARTRDENAAYLTGLLRETPGLVPVKKYDGCTRSALHLYMMRYDSREFADLPRAKFLQALTAEGVPCSGGYALEDWTKLVKAAFSSRGGQRVFPESMFNQWAKNYRLPEYEKVCNEAVWFVQTMFLGSRTDMEQIVEAVRKIRAGAAALAKK